MYMGEVARQVLVDLVRENLIFVGKDTSNLMKHGRFYTKYVSEIESDPVGDYTRARMALQELDIDPDDVTTEDFSSLRYVLQILLLLYFL